MVVLLDSIKAFDTVWHDALLLKLFQYGIIGDLWLLLDEMYSDMQNCILFNCNFYRWFKLKRGVRQGVFISAVLYLVYSNDLLRQISESNFGCMMNDLNVSSSVQADDITLVTTSELRMQSLISMCEVYSNK